MNKYKLLVAVLVISLAGCASNKEPSFGETLQAEGKSRTDLGKQWSKGQEMIKDGNKLIKKGKKQIATGKQNVSKGESLISDGEDLIRKIEESHRQSRTW